MKATAKQPHATFKLRLFVARKMTLELFPLCNAAPDKKVRVESIEQNDYIKTGNNRVENNIVRYKIAMKNQGVEQGKQRQHCQQQ